jgi:hypothetical protein
MKLEFLYPAVLMWAACANTPGPETKSKFVFKETIAIGDTGMITFGRLRPLNFTYDLCQQWELRDADDANTKDLTHDPKTGDRIFQEIMLYPDSSVSFNPRNGYKMGKWKLGQRDNKLLLILKFNDSSSREYVILQKKYNELSLAWKQGDQRFGMRLRSDAKAHANMQNDPFYPANNAWRIRPNRLESDSELRERVKNCIRFYALYFRDHILRHRTDINFAGLPSCFIWYNRGIGIYEIDALPLAWKKCFYSTPQAIKGRNIIQKMFDKNGFVWPTGTPSWFYDSHAVLEQMYHRL